MAALEKELSEVENELADPSNARNHDLYKQYADKKKQLEDVSDQWLTLSEELEGLH